MLYAMPEKTAHSICETFAVYEINFGNREIGIAKMKDLLERAIDLRTKLAILLTLAEIDIENGESRSAEDKLNEIISKGNKLYIVDLAKEMLGKIT